MAMLVMPIEYSPYMHTPQVQPGGLGPCRSPATHMRCGHLSVLPPQRRASLGSAMSSSTSAVFSAGVPPHHQAVRFFVHGSSLPPAYHAPVRPAVVTPWPNLQMPEVPSVAPTNVADIRAWTEAARSFEMNTDFDILGLAPGRHLDLTDYMTLMKDQSVGKRTIQALADKVMMHTMLDNLGVPQLPLRLSVRGQVKPEEIEQFVLNHLCRPGSEELVLKPSHLSNAAGVMCLSQPPPHEIQSCIQYITQHVYQFMGTRAGAHESAAMKALRPGFLAQPKYQSVVGFEAPLELRVIVLWGKARLAVWWWGRSFGGPGENPARNAWLVRRLLIPGHISDDDPWEVIHQHTGSNPGFDKALKLFERHISAIAATAEAVAVAVGAPFLRTDFFVGSPTWGVRLNEVAYGCGCDYRNLASDGSGRIVDDGPTVVQILQEGLRHCFKRMPPDHFLSRLGVRGQTYADSIVVPLLPALRCSLPERALKGDSDLACRDCAVPDVLCKTARPLPFRSITAPTQSKLSFQPTPINLMSQYAMKCPRCSSHSLTLHAHLMS